MDFLLVFPMNILAIESSCDETAAAVIKDGTEIISNVVASSSAMHEKWGGIVPEVAAREQLKSIMPVIIESLTVFQPTTHNPQLTTNSLYKSIIENNIDAIAVTVGPGLIGSLLIGTEVAKTISFVCNKPIIPVNHVLAHMYANFLETCETRDVKRNKQKTNISRITCHVSPITFPAISLVVSGGHTELYLMKSIKEIKWLGGTIDDAAGEAFDKTARLLGFGSRGGLAVQESANKCKCHCESRSDRDEAILKDRPSDRIGIAMTQRKNTVYLPRPMIHDDTLNFSFSGLKTAILREVNKLKNNKQFNNLTVQQLSYEVQEAITDVLVTKTLRAVELHNAKSILISGGVASNLRLREKFIQQLKTCDLSGEAGSRLAKRDPAPQDFARQLTTRFPPIELCTDNAAFIGSYAYFRGEKTTWEKIEAIPDLSVEITA